MYETFPASREDLQLSLLVSLIGGTIGGLFAAVVSNPADATISEMKKTKSDMSPIAAAELVIEKGGIPGLFRGLPLRLVFYARESVCVDECFSFVFDYELSPF